MPTIFVPRAAAINQVAAHLNGATETYNGIKYKNAYYHPYFICEGGLHLTTRHLEAVMADITPLCTEQFWGADIQVKAQMIRSYLLRNPSTDGFSLQGGLKNGILYKKELYDLIDIKFEGNDKDFSVYAVLYKVMVLDNGSCTMYGQHPFDDIYITIANRPTNGLYHRNKPQCGLWFGNIDRERFYGACAKVTKIDGSTAPKPDRTRRAPKPDNATLKKI